MFSRKLTVRTRFVAGYLILGLLCTPLQIEGQESQKQKDQSTLAAISIDFPHGETRLVVNRSGEASLYYGALDRECVIKPGTFDIDKLYRRLRGRLHPNLPAEERPEPTAKYGMVHIHYKDKGEKYFLVYDGKFAERLFEKARKNLIGEAGLVGPPSRWPCLPLSKARRKS